MYDLKTIRRMEEALDKFGKVPRTKVTRNTGDRDVGKAYSRRRASRHLAWVARATGVNPVTGEVVEPDESD